MQNLTHGRFLRIFASMGFEDQPPGTVDRCSRRCGCVLHQEHTESSWVLLVPSL
jgi:hypothetical protein